MRCAIVAGQPLDAIARKTSERNLSAGGLQISFEDRSNAQDSDYDYDDASFAFTSVTSQPPKATALSANLLLLQLARRNRNGLFISPQETAEQALLTRDHETHSGRRV